MKQLNNGMRILLFLVSLYTASSCSSCNSTYNKTSNPDSNKIDTFGCESRPDSLYFSHIPSFKENAFFETQKWLEKQIGIRFYKTKDTMIKYMNDTTSFLRFNLFQYKSSYIITRQDSCPLFTAYSLVKSDFNNNAIPIFQTNFLKDCQIQIPDKSNFVLSIGWPDPGTNSYLTYSKRNPIKVLYININVDFPNEWIK